MTLRERIIARLALAEAATPGPWTTYGHAEREKGCMCFEPTLPTSGATFNL